MHPTIPLVAAVVGATLLWAAPHACGAEVAAKPEQAGLDRTVTLDLRCVSVRRAVERLGEEARLPLACAPGLAERGVTLWVESKPAQAAADLLARTVCARWRSKGGRLTLEPAPAYEVLTPQELGALLQAALLPSRLSRVVQADVGRCLVAAIMDLVPQGQPFSARQLPPQQQQILDQLLMAHVLDETAAVRRTVGRIQGLGETTVSLDSEGGPGDLRVHFPDGFSTGLPAPREGR